MGTAVAAGRRPISDLEIEEWICERWGFAPHPFWISDCRQLYLNEEYNQPLGPRYKCPPDKRLAIRAAFVHFGLLAA